MSLTTSSSMMDPSNRLCRARVERWSNKQCLNNATEYHGSDPICSECSQTRLRYGFEWYGTITGDEKHAPTQEDLQHIVRFQDIKLTEMAMTLDRFSNRMLEMKKEFEITERSIEGSLKPLISDLQTEVQSLKNDREQMAITIQMLKQRELEFQQKLYAIKLFLNDSDD